jgi:hypothetical protein
MGEIKEEISIAIKSLGLTSEDIIGLDYETGKKIFSECLNHFVKSGDRRWWWEDFKQYSFSIDHYEKPFEHLNELIPDLNKKVWLMVEDDQEEYYPIYDCNPKIIKDLIGECVGFEYYIIAKDKKWLICENHHSRLIGAGEFPNI